MKPSRMDLAFPKTRVDGDRGYTLHGRRFDDPYAWLEQLDEPETQAWIAAQEAVTYGVLRTVPGRAWLRAAVERSARHARLSPPLHRGRDRELLWHADVDDERLKVVMRRGPDAPFEAVIDPNTSPRAEPLDTADGRSCLCRRAPGGGCVGLHLCEHVGTRVLIDGKDLGALKIIRATNCQDTRPPNIRLSKAIGGGPVEDVGIYCINAARYLTGEMPIEVMAMAHRSNEPRFAEVPESLVFSRCGSRRGCSRTRAVASAPSSHATSRRSAARAGSRSRTRSRIAASR